MNEWKPNIGKWEDTENYNIQTPIWRKMFNVISEYEEAKEVQRVLIVLGNWNITGYDIREYIVGYVIHQKGLDLREFMSKEMMQKVKDCSLNSKNIKEYTKKILEECHVSNAVIDEIESEI